MVNQAAPDPQEKMPSHATKKPAAPPALPVPWDQWALPEHQDNLDPTDNPVAQEAQDKTDNPADPEKPEMPDKMEKTEPMEKLVRMEHQESKELKDQPVQPVHLVNRAVPVTMVSRAALDKAPLAQPGPPVQPEVMANPEVMALQVNLVATELVDTIPSTAHARAVVHPADTHKLRSPPHPAVGTATDTVNVSRCTVTVLRIVNALVVCVVVNASTVNAWCTVAEPVSSAFTAACTSTPPLFENAITTNVFQSSHVSPC